MKLALRWWDYALLAMLCLSILHLGYYSRTRNPRYDIFDGGTRQDGVAGLAELSTPPALQAGEFTEIAESMLFRPGRDTASRGASMRAVQPPKVALPRLFGIADLGDGPAALLAARPGMRAEWVRPGQPVGEFVLRSVSPAALVFLRSGIAVTATPEELREPERVATRAVPSNRVNAPSPPATRVGNETAARRPPGGEYRVGAEFRPGRFAADPNDGATDGTTSGGFVRRVHQSPFGAQHWWEREEP